MPEQRGGTPNRIGGMCQNRVIFPRLSHDNESSPTIGPISFLNPIFAHQLTILYRMPELNPRLLTERNKQARHDARQYKM